MIPIRINECGVAKSIRMMMVVGALAASYQAAAVEMTIGDVDVSINSTVTAGTSWRTESRDRALYGANNVDETGQAGTGQSNTGDDGNLNFDKGDVFSTIIKGVHDIEAKKENYGFFGRVKWFYDYQLNTEALFHGHEPTGNQRYQELNDSGFHPYARFDGIDILDAFGYLNTEVGDMPLDVRLGRQVIAWGESTLILSPISGLNTIDVSAFRRPGASLKEGFTPSEMLYANLGLADNTSLEAFYQLKWRKTVIEGCGTYFSTADFAADGCDRLAFVGRGVPDSVQLSPGFGTPGSPGFSAPPFFAPVNRSEDVQPGNSGQMGLALRKYFTDLDTEFGLYLMNYHSRLPMISVKAGNTPVPATLPLGPNGASVPAQAVGLTPGNSLPYAFGNLSGSYYIDYPEDIPVLGLSAVTDVGGWALSGEFSYAGDVPIQYNPNDLLAATLTYGVGNPNGPNPLDQKLRQTKPGDRFNGYERFDVAQLQSTLIKTFDQVLGSSQVVFIGEAAAVFVRDLPEALPGQRFGRNAVFGSGAAGADGYVTDFSWGYRLRSRATYRNMLGNVDLIPSIAWAHDVKGWSPEPGQNFNEGRRSTTLGLTFEFDANTQANVSYTNFADSAKYNPLRDRDFATVSVSMSF